MGQYRRNLFEGMKPLAAGEAAFGDLDVLERELEAYLRGRRFMMVPLGADKLSTGSPIALRKLPAGEAAIMPLVIRSQRGVDAEEAAKILPEVRAIAAKYPDDAGVLAALAEAEYDAGNNAEAIAAADRAIAADPSRPNAYVQKGYALFRQAGEAEDQAAAYEAAMKPFEALNAIENDHPLPLIYYYRSFAERGATPPESARSALEYASRLAPFDQALQVNTGMMLIKEGKPEIARSFLAPVAANPHGGGAAEQAKRILDLLAKAPPGGAIKMDVVPAETGSSGAAETGE
jgi:tetratricopeptide (TPR) repeat protein